MSENVNNGSTGTLNEQQSGQEKKPLATLLSSISYTDRNDYENFLKNLTQEHAVIVLIAAANHGQAKGLFNLEEAELVAKSIKRLTAGESLSTNQPQANEE